MATIVDVHGHPSHPVPEGDGPGRHASGIIKSLKDARDAILILGTILYVVGYATWSYIAWRRGFGSLPLIDSQYLIAGIAPTVVLILTAVAVYLLHLFVRVRFADWLRRCSLRNLILFHAVALGIALMGGALMWLNKPESGSSYSVAFIVGAVVFLVGGLAMDPVVLNQRVLSALAARLPDTSEHDDDRERLAALERLAESGFVGMQGSRGAVLLIPILLAVFVLWQYTEYGYTNLPQALGGAAPRCVQFDVARKDLSALTLSKLGVPAKSAQDSAEVATTTQLYLHLASGGDLLVSRDADSRGKTALIQLPKSAAKAMSWCD